MSRSQLPDWLIRTLKCLRCSGSSSFEQTDEGLVCTACGRVYRLHNGIPLMLPDDDERSGSVEDTADPRAEP